FSAGFWQMAKVLMTKRITIDVAFSTMLQRADGSFAPSAGQPFETKLSLDLKRGIESSPTAVRGDYNGDGITDLIAFTDPPAALLPLTPPEGALTPDPAVSVPLPRRPEDGALIDIQDLDGDGRSDVAFFGAEGEGFVLTALRSGP